MKIQYVSLLLPFLAGCTGSPGNNRTVPDTPALVFVDGQISDSVAVINHTQQRLAPVAAPPVAPSTAPTTATVAPLPAYRPQPAPAPSSAPRPLTSVSGNLSALTMVGTPEPAAVLSLSPARNLTLEQWFRRIIPSGWQLEYENGLRSRLSIRIVSVDTNDQWTRVLNRLLTEQSLQGQIDWNRKALTLRQNSATGVPQPTSQSSGPTAPTSAVNNPVPVVQAAPAKTWSASAGSTLRENVVKWASDTKCEATSKGWAVIWPASVTDYPLDAPLVFRGSFESMLSQVFELYHNAQKPLYARASRTQCVISVTDKPAG
ncbi:TcpQ domain-containing protein [Salmonella enterica]|nr:TcpQ domain-containing protein [Salmonella enterica]